MSVTPIADEAAGRYSEAYRKRVLATTVTGLVWQNELSLVSIRQIADALLDRRYSDVNLVVVLKEFRRQARQEAVRNRKTSKIDRENISPEKTSF